MEPHSSPLLPFSSYIGSPREEDADRYSAGNAFEWGMPESPPSTRKELLDSPRSDKIFGNWVQDKDGRMISYWEMQGSSSVLFSPLMQQKNEGHLHYQQQTMVEALTSQGDQSPTHDEDGFGDGLEHFRFEFDSDGDEEEDLEDEDEINGFMDKKLLVAHLNKMGYPVGLCYQAVEKFGNNTDGALRWLANNSFNPTLTSNPWVNLSMSIPSTPLPLSSTDTADGPNEYFTYTHNVKNTNKLNTSTGNFNSFSNSLYASGGISNHSLNTSAGGGESYGGGGKVLGGGLGASSGFGPTTTTSTTSVSMPVDFYDLSKKQPCRYFLSGYCKNGDNCTFLHPPTSNVSPSAVAPISTSPSPLPSPQVLPSSAPSSTMTCRFYTSGYCRKGASCPYLHTISLTPPSTPPPVNATSPPLTMSPTFPSTLSIPSSTPSTSPIPTGASSHSFTFLSPSPCPSPSPPPTISSPMYSPALSSSPAPSLSPASPASPSLVPSPLPFSPAPAGWEIYDFPLGSSPQQIPEALRQSVPASHIPLPLPLPLPIPLPLPLPTPAPLSLSGGLLPPSPTIPIPVNGRPPTAKQEAQRYFRVGIRHYHECEFEKALTNFTQSYQLYPSRESQAMIAKTLEFKRDDDVDPFFSGGSGSGSGGGSDVDPFRRRAAMQRLLVLDDDRSYFSTDRSTIASSMGDMEGPGNTYPQLHSSMGAMRASGGILPPHFSGGAASFGNAIGSSAAGWGGAVGAERAGGNASSGGASADPTPGGSREREAEEEKRRAGSLGSSGTTEIGNVGGNSGGNDGQVGVEGGMGVGGGVTGAWRMGGPVITEAKADGGGRGVGGKSNGSGALPAGQGVAERRREEDDKKKKWQKKGEKEEEKAKEKKDADEIEREKERIKKEKKVAEEERKEREAKERKEREKAEAEKKERERKEKEKEKAEAEKKERERKEKERAEAEKREKEKKEKLEAAKKEKERLERERKEKAEAERREKERLEAERREKERIEAERKEAEAKEKREKERIEAEKRERERERIESEKRQKEREAKERKDKLEAEKREKERAEAERREKEKEKEKERERIEREKKERERAEAERKEKERKEKEKAEAERKEKEEKERKEKERKEKERADAEKEAKERERKNREREERERKEREAKEEREKAEAQAEWERRGGEGEREGEEGDQDSSCGVAGVPGRDEFSTEMPDLLSDEEDEDDKVDSDNGEDEIPTVKRIINATDYYQVLNLLHSASIEEINNQYKVIMQIVHDNGSEESVIKMVSQAYSCLSDSQKRVEYDALLKIKSSPSSAGNAYARGGFVDSARMFLSMMVLAVIAILLFLKQAVASIARTVMRKPRAGKGTRGRRGEASPAQWCSACGAYHAAPTTYTPSAGRDGEAGGEGSFWEENGRYYFLQGATKHDVTNFVQDRYWRSGGHGGDREEGGEGGPCQFCRAQHRHPYDETQQSQESERQSSKAKKKLPTPSSSVATTTNNPSGAKKTNNSGASKRKKH